MAIVFNEVIMLKGMQFDTLILPNQLQVLTISDERFVKASAALAVMAGSMQNPEEHLGLAHFLEHMLFLGTQEFPQVGEYEDYLNKNGGGHNAYTSIDHTNYFFDVAPTAFQGALERFSRFFVSPTFDPQYVEREKNAVNSEHEKNLLDDHRREYRFLQLTTDPKHPFSLFSTGDANTLKNADRQVVMEFYQKYYSSNLMRLVLMGPMSSQELKQMAHDFFSDIENKNAPTPVYGEELYQNTETQVINFIETVRDQDTLKLSFSVPDDTPYWESKPTSFLAQLLGDEGEGSLLSGLKKKGLAVGLETSNWWRLFHVRVHLTEQGKSNYQEVIRSIFSFIELVRQKGLEPNIFKERQRMAQFDFDCIEPKSSMSRASHFSASMLYYPINDFLKRYYLYHKQDNKVFQMFLDCLNPQNLKVSLFSKNIQGTEKEPYYGIEYRTEKLPSRLIKEITEPQLDPLFAYPGENPYVPSDLQLVQTARLAEPKIESYQNQATLYSQVDTELEIPKGHYSMGFVSPWIVGDYRRFLLIKLFTKLKKEELNEWSYLPHVAGLNYNISHGYNTVTLEVSGYSQHLTHLLRDLIVDPKNDRRLDQLNVDSDVFDRVKEDYKKEVFNKDHDAAYQHLLYEAGQQFSTAAVHRERYRSLIDGISLAEVQAAAQEFFRQVSIKTYGYGNILPEEMKPVVDLYFKTTQAKSLTDQEIRGFENQYAQWPAQKWIVQRTGENNNNAQLTFYRMSEWSLSNHARVEVLGKILEQPYFTELRTHQQLGYIVAAFPSTQYGFCGLATLIQSQSHSASEILDRSNRFMDEFMNQFAEYAKAEDIEIIKDSLIQEITQKPNSMSERLGRFTQMAGTYHGDFNFYQKWAAETQKITHQDLITFMNQYLKSSERESQFAFVYTQEPKALAGYEWITERESMRKKWPSHQPYRQT